MINRESNDIKHKFSLPLFVGITGDHFIMLTEKPRESGHALALKYRRLERKACLKAGSLV